jgi:hypothetical protein
MISLLQQKYIIFYFLNDQNACAEAKTEHLRVHRSSINRLNRKDQTTVCKLFKVAYCHPS